MPKFCIHEQHAGICEKTGGYCNEGACPHEEMVDYAPVVHGQWEKHGSKWQCTNCKVLMSIDGTPQENLLHYCPNCGAYMMGENNE